MWSMCGLCGFCRILTGIGRNHRAPSSCVVCCAAEDKRVSCHWKKHMARFSPEATTFCRTSGGSIPSVVYNVFDSTSTNPHENRAVAGQKLWIATNLRMIIALDLPHTSQGRSKPSLPAALHLFCHQKIHQKNMLTFRLHWDFYLVASFTTSINSSTSYPYPAHLFFPSRKGYTAGFFMRYTVLPWFLAFYHVFFPSFVCQFMAIRGDTRPILAYWQVGFGHFRRDQTGDQTWGQLVPILIGWNSIPVVKTKFIVCLLACLFVCLLVCFLFVVLYTH